MKNSIFILLLICCAFQINAQESYSIEGKSYELKTEVQGNINLLWNIIDGHYRYFIQKGSAIKELVNTKNEEGDYTKDYIATLKEFTSDADVPYDNVKLLLYSLKDFINIYNAAVDSDYTYESNKIAVKTRLGFSGGVTNNPFTTNPDNVLSALIAAEYELYDDHKAKRHGATFGLRHAFENKQLKYVVTELSLGYRYKFILKKNFSAYGTLKLATFSASKSTVTYTDEMDQPITEKRKGSSFDAPVILSLGADIKVGTNGFLTLSYGELFALFLDNQGNFSTDFSIGYKFNL